jgi:hypothetical protein
MRGTDGSDGKDDGDGGADGSGAAAPSPAAAAAAADPKVLVDSWVEQASGDERLAWLLIRELPIPDPPKGADENLPPADDD